MCLHPKDAWTGGTKKATLILEVKKKRLIRRKYNYHLKLIDIHICILVKL